MVAARRHQGIVLTGSGGGGPSSCHGVARRRVERGIATANQGRTHCDCSEPLDVDSFSLAAPISGTFQLKLCSSGGAFSLNGLQTNNIAYGPLAGIDAAGCTTRSFQSGVWKGFYIVRKNASSPGGDYTLEITASDVVWPRPPAVTLARASDARIRATLNASAVPGGVAGSELRWLQTGAGFVKVAAATDPNALLAPAIAPSAFLGNGRPVQLRAQLWRDGMPIEEPSRAYAVSAPNAPLTSLMTEYRFAPLDYYFTTSRDDDKAALDALGLAGWARTGKSFTVFAGQVAETKALNRYYFDKVALGATRGSHFYTLIDADKVALASLNPANSLEPGKPYNEGVDSYAYLPVVTGVGGSCASGLTPVYRVFRAATRFPDDPNHRFTTQLAVYNQMVTLGWNGEGVSMCTPAGP